MFCVFCNENEISKVSVKIRQKWYVLAELFSFRYWRFGSAKTRFGRKFGNKIRPNRMVRPNLQMSFGRNRRFGAPLISGTDQAFSLNLHFLPHLKISSFSRLSQIKSLSVIQDLVRECAKQFAYNQSFSHLFHSLGSARAVKPSTIITGFQQGFSRKITGLFRGFSHPSPRLSVQHSFFSSAVVRKQVLFVINETV